MNIPISISSWFSPIVCWILLESDVDVALRIGELGDSSLIASRVGTARRVTCASPSYLAAQGRPQNPEDLRNHICVTFDNLASPEAWRFSSPKGDVLVPIRSRLTVTTAEAAVAGAVAGLGLRGCYLIRF
ncbi:MAG: LysR substrate-binding domain-containing protein [Acetobacteraceae bacterium]